MRIWDINPQHLCRQHLLAEHRELHGLWNILTKHGGRGGYSRHPETLRWVGKTKALYERHEALVKEFVRRGYQHRTPLDKRLARGQGGQDVFLQTLAEQRVILKKKPCACLLPKTKFKKKGD
ncbi:TPA: pyrimidine dimer DNA glycosylase [Candidatus Falkowbacteria bacterium]|nr:MAG: Pyrimidine dimer DNA glycosylase [Candidatus Falkowbacteria bacterium GW2011_GWF2_43_32]HBA37007.1 pyrimidine dimer DNA glycosylase [Candidatus Falkowbacteria bacterium]